MNKILFACWMTWVLANSVENRTPTESLRMRSGHAGEFAEAFHFGAGGHGAVLLHHLAHLHVLLYYGVDVLDGGAASGGDAFAAFAVDYVMVAALLIGHGVDDRFDLF